MESANQTYPGKNENCSHHKGAYDSPKQNFVLLVTRDSEIAKDQEKDEQVIYTQRKLDYVAGYEFQTGSPPVPEIDQYREGASESNPHSTPDQRFAKADPMGSTMEYSKVQKQHRRDKNIKQDPEGGLAQQIPQRFNSAHS